MTARKKKRKAVIDVRKAWIDSTIELSHPRANFCMPTFHRLSNSNSILSGPEPIHAKNDVSGKIVLMVTERGKELQ